MATEDERKRQIMEHLSRSTGQFIKRSPNASNSDRKKTGDGSYPPYSRLGYFLCQLSNHHGQVKPVRAAAVPSDALRLIGLGLFF